MEARENILNDELYELDFRICFFGRLQSEPDIFSEEINRDCQPDIGIHCRCKTRNVFRMSRYENKSIKEIAGYVEYHASKVSIII